MRKDLSEAERERARGDVENSVNSNGALMQALH